MEMDAIIGQIKEFEFFKGFTDEELSLVAGGMSARKVPEEELLFTQHDETRDIYFVTKGLFTITMHSFPTEQRVKELGVGEPIGEIAFVDGFARSANVIAAKDCECLCFPREKFDELSKDHPQLALKFLSSVGNALCHRLREMSFRFVEIT